MEEQLTFCFEPIGPWLLLETDSHLWNSSAWIRNISCGRAAHARRKGFERGVVYLNIKETTLYIYEDGNRPSSQRIHCVSVDEAKQAFDKMLPTLKFINYK